MPRELTCKISLFYCECKQAAKYRRAYCRQWVQAAAATCNVQLRRIRNRKRQAADRRAPRRVDRTLAGRSQLRTQSCRASQHGGVLLVDAHPDTQRVSLLCQAWREHSEADSLNKHSENIGLRSNWAGRVPHALPDEKSLQTSLHCTVEQKHENTVTRFTNWHSQCIRICCLLWLNKQAVRAIVGFALVLFCNPHFVCFLTCTWKATKVCTSY